MRSFLTVFIALTSCFVAPLMAAAQPTTELESSSSAESPDSKIPPSPDIEPLEGGVDIDLSFGVSGVGEVFPTASGAALNWGGGEWAADLSGSITDSDGCALIPLCGPIWTSGLGARFELAARGLVTAGEGGRGPESGSLMDLHVEESAEVALWYVSVKQTFSYQRDPAFWRDFWRPHSNTMTAGAGGGFSMLSAMDANGGIEVLSLYFDWRRLIEDPTKEATNPAEEATNLANEIRIDIALLDGFVSPNERWFERLALGVVSVDYYDVAVGREGETRVTEEAMSLLFDYGVIEGFRLWDAPWKIDATLGMSVVSPIAEVRRTPVDNPDGTVSVDYEGGPSTISPHLWAAVHHVAEGTDHGDGQSVIFEAIPADAVFGVGVGSFQRLDGSGMAADFGAQAAAYGRVPLSTNLTLRAEALAIIAERGAVSELTTDLPIKSGESFFMGRVDAGLDWSLGKHWLVSTTAWLEQSDRELSTADSSPLGPRARAGVRAGLYFTY